LIPMENKKDLVEVPKTILESMEIIPVKNVDEVLKVALTKNLKSVEWVEVDQISNKEKSKKELSTH
jgi:ATP-dependent Lon protease